MELTSLDASYLRMVLYPVQYERHPRDGVERVIGMIKSGEMLKFETAELLVAIETGLSSDTKLSDIIPQTHSEEAIRAYLSELARRLQSDSR